MLVGANCCARIHVRPLNCAPRSVRSAYRASFTERGPTIGSRRFGPLMTQFINYLLERLRKHCYSPQDSEFIMEECHDVLAGGPGQKMKTISWKFTGSPRCMLHVHPGAPAVEPHFGLKSGNGRDVTADNRCDFGCCWAELWYVNLDYWPITDVTVIPPPCASLWVRGLVLVCGLALDHIPLNQTARCISNMDTKIQRSKIAYKDQKEILHINTKFQATW